MAVELVAAFVCVVTIIAITLTHHGLRFGTLGAHTLQAAAAFVAWVARLIFPYTVSVALKLFAFQGAATVEVFFAVSAFPSTRGILGTFKPFAFQQATAFVVFFTIAGYTMTNLGSTLGIHALQGAAAFVVFFARGILI